MYIYLSIPRDFSFLIGILSSKGMLNDLASEIKIQAQNM